MHDLQTVKATVAAKIRAYRVLRRLDQADLAQRMGSLGIPWRQATVSEIEREGGGRNVTITEMLGLALALDVTIEQLVDSRGPDGWRGPYMILTDKTGEPGIPPASVTALLCRHEARFEPAWNGNHFAGISINTTDDPPKLLYSHVHGTPESSPEESRKR